MSHEHHLREFVKRIPADVREIIIEQGMIDKATDAYVEGGPMEYLFDVYSEYCDPGHELGDFTCPNCRWKVLRDFRKFKPYIIELNHAGK